MPRALILISLFSISVAAKVAKTDPLVTPLGPDAYITFGDLQTLNWKLNASFVAIIAWFLLQAWESHKKSKDTTAEDIRFIKEALAEMKGELSARPTWKELHGKER